MNQSPITNELDHVITQLKSSPLYNLSLANNELFHSNFLAWLCEMYPVQLGLLFAPFMPTATGGAIVGVHREFRNIDLTLVYANGETLIIENKVKSLPYLAQLEEYAAKVTNKPNTAFLLLSLTEPYFLDKVKRTIPLEDGTIWHFLSYKELSKKLQDLHATIAAANAYHGQLVNDYITFIEGLDRVQTLFHFEPNDDNFNFFISHEEMNKLSDICLDSLIDKLRYATFAECVAERLTQKGFSVIRDNWWMGKVGQVHVSSDMKNTGALFDLKYIVTEAKGTTSPVMVGIQIQDNIQGKRKKNHFRLVLEYSDKERILKIAERLLHPTSTTSQNWFDFFLILTPPQEYPKKGNFNRYSDTFLYRAKKLDNISPLKLIELILEYAKLMQAKQSVIAGEVVKASM